MVSASQTFGSHRACEPHFQFLFARTSRCRTERPTGKFDVGSAGAESINRSSSWLRETPTRPQRLHDRIGTFDLQSQPKNGGQTMIG